MANGASRSWWNVAGGMALGVVAVGMLANLVPGRGGLLPGLAAERGKEPPAISVSGHSEIMAVPDIAYVSLGIITRQKSARLAAEINARTARAITSSVKRQGIQEKDVQTRDYSMNPWVVYVRGREKRLGYEVCNSIRVAVRDLKTIGDVIDAGLGAGANSIQGVAFGFADENAVRRSVLAAAVEDARKKAEAVATTLSVKVGQPLSVTEGDQEGGGLYKYKLSMRRVAHASEPASRAFETPISPGQLKVTQDIQAVFAIGK